MMFSIELQDANFLTVSVPELFRGESRENILSSFSFGIKKLISSVKYLRKYTLYIGSTGI